MDMSGFMTEGYKKLKKPDGVYDPACGILASCTGDVTASNDLGYMPDDIIYAFPKTDGVENVLGKCRIAADNIDIINYINDIADLKTNGTIQKIGLAVIPKGYEGCGRGIPFDEITEISQKIKRLSCITVRGAYINGYTENLSASEMGKYFHCCYQTAKQLTVMIPCAMPYLVFGNCLDRMMCLKDTDDKYVEAVRNAEIVAMQNETAFYSKMFIT